MGKTIVVALGGNALVRPGQKGTASDQLANLEGVAGQIAALHNRGFRIVLTHGNGPQVGTLLVQQEKARDYAPRMPLHVCVAQSQGMIGYFLQEALYNQLRRRGFRIPVVTVLTQVLVDPADRAFQSPSKPIGPYYHSSDSLPRHWKMTRTVKGFRRVVPSPKPRRIIEAEEIRRISRDAIVIACGGGGIPVVQEHGLKGVEAVIDKDLSAALLARVVKADTLAILTDVDFAYLDYRRPSQRKLGAVTPEQMKAHYEQGHFPPGSMGPKVQAALHFLRWGGKRALITSLDRLEDGLNGDWGTSIQVPMSRGKK